MNCRLRTDDIVTICVRFQVPYFYILKFFAIPLWCPVFIAFFSLHRKAACVCVCLFVLSFCYFSFAICIFVVFVTLIVTSDPFSYSASNKNTVYVGIFVFIFFAFVICFIREANKTPKTVPKTTTMFLSKIGILPTRQWETKSRVTFLKNVIVSLCFFFGGGGWGPRVDLICFLSRYERTMEVGIFLSVCNFYICHVHYTNTHSMDSPSPFTINHFYRHSHFCANSKSLNTIVGTQYGIVCMWYCK